jgi:hypothetical protein
MQKIGCPAGFVRGQRVVDCSSFTKGRIEVGTKHRNHDDCGTDDTNQTQVGYSVTSKVQS